MRGGRGNTTEWFLARGGCKSRRSQPLGLLRNCPVFFIVRSISVRSHIEMEELKLPLYNIGLDKTSFHICLPLASIPFMQLSAFDSFSSAAWLLHPRTAWRPGVFEDWNWSLGLKGVPKVRSLSDDFDDCYHSFCASSLQHPQPYWLHRASHLVCLWGSHIAWQLTWIEARCWAMVAS